MLDPEFGQTTKWQGDRLIIISAFWDAAPHGKRLGLALRGGCERFTAPVISGLVGVAGGLLPFTRRGDLACVRRVVL